MTGCHSRLPTGTKLCPGKVTCRNSALAAALVEDYDPNRIECDGTFPAYEGATAGDADGPPLIIEEKVGKGTVIVTSIHEYPSRAFVKQFCAQGTQTLF